MMVDFKKVGNIYRKMGDETSRKIFADRLLYSMTGDAAYLQNVINTTLRGNRFLSKLKAASDSGIVIFGTGLWGKEIYQATRDFGWKSWVDSNPREKELYHLPVISFKYFISMYNGETVVVSSRLYHEQMVEQLLDAGVPAEKIIDAGQELNRFLSEQYFDLDVMPHAEGKEIFVDAGSFDGMSSIRFKEWSEGETYVYAFEPDALNAKKCMENLTKNGIPCKVIQKGLWSRDGRLPFKTEASAMSKICREGELTVSVTSLDQALEGADVTYIKMDIEGSELETLRGGVQTITRCRPKLAVSIYHKPEDILELPELILSYHPDYRLYLRHYSLAAFDTVLYAI